MVKFFQPGKSKAQSKTRKTIVIDDVTTRGEGVCVQHSPAIFVEGALPGERVNVAIDNKSKSHWKGKLASKKTSIENPHSERTKPFCKHIDACGGCTTQHCAPETMLMFKQNAFGKQFKHVLGLEQIPWTDPIHSPSPEYRRKARLAIDVRNPKKRKLGFKASGSSSVVNVNTCPILDNDLQQIMALLSERILAHETPINVLKNIGHITLLKTELGCSVTINSVRDWSKASSDWWSSCANQLQEVGVGTVMVVVTQGNQSIECWHLHLGKDTVASANDFIQVNASVNERMLELAKRSLNLSNKDVVMDLFCGMGNFSLQLAAHAQNVIGVEGSEAMVQKATQIALQRGMTNVANFARNLNQANSLSDLWKFKPNKVLLDPSREGALEVCEQLATSSVECIVYISCNPQSWLRDVQVLLKDNFTLSSLTLMDMFPYTPHSELLSVFIKK